MKFNKNQYLTLLTALQTAGFVYSILGDAVDSKYKKRALQLEELEDVVLEDADSYGMSHYVEIFDKKRCLNDKFMARIMPDIIEFEEFAFFDILTRRMASKEFMETYSEDEVKHLSEEEVFDIMMTLEEKYHQLFEVFGVGCLDVKDLEE